MMTASPPGEQKRPDTSMPLNLEIFLGNGESRQFPVMVTSLSARGVILATYLAPEDLNLEGSAGRDSVIHLTTGEITEIRGNLLWARPRDEDGPEVIFGLELSCSDLKVRRALEEQLLDYPQDLKNLWDHWDAVHEDHEAGHLGQPVTQEDPQVSPPEPAVTRNELAAPPPQKLAPPSDHAIYWVGVGAVVGGLSIYFMGPESYRLFGVILSLYGSLTIAGKSMWSMFQKRTEPQE